MSDIFLQVANLTKVFYSKKQISITALDDVSFELRKGEIFSLLGINGAGKTTLSSILATLHPPTSGSIFWGGKSIYGNLLSYRKMVGFCPQEQNLDPCLTLKQNLLFQGRYYGISKEKLEEKTAFLLKKFELEEYAKRKVEVLSGGYKRRFLIARTLIHSPRFVILDEPTVGLDPQLRRKLWYYISFLKEEGVTVLLTTHYLDEAEKLSDRVCLIDHGKIVVIDTPEKLKKDMKKENLEDAFLHLLHKEKED